MRQESKHAQAVLQGDNHQAAIGQSGSNHRVGRSGPVAAAMYPDEYRQSALAAEAWSADVQVQAIFRAALGVGAVPTNIGLQAGGRRLDFPENSGRQGGWLRWTPTQ